MEDLHTLAISLLNEAMGAPALDTSSVGRWTTMEWLETDSTNSRAMKALRQSDPGIFDHFALRVAHQNAGRGQQQRAWVSEANQDLVMTLIVAQNLPKASPFALNSAISLAVLQAIEDTLPTIRSEELEIKWPNDIMWKGAKAGGILIENNWRGDNWSSAVIGIGINLAGTPPFPNATRLLSEAPSSEHVRRLSHAILNRADQRLAETGNPEALLQQFHQRLLGWGLAQRWLLDGEEVRGVLENIDIEGRLCVSSDGRRHCFSPGEVGWLGMEPR